MNEGMMGETPYIIDVKQPDGSTAEFVRRHMYKPTIVDVPEETMDELRTLAARLAEIACDLGVTVINMHAYAIDDTWGPSVGCWVVKDMSHKRQQLFLERV